MKYNMSGVSGMAPCPICGKQMSTYIDWKPFDTASGECPHCGFYYYTERNRMSFDDLNKHREEYNEDRGLSPNKKGYLKRLTLKQYEKLEEKMQNIL